MDGWSDIAEQGRRLIEQHLPAEAIPPVAPVAIVALLVGVMVAVLGARLARPVLTAGFGVAGALAALRYACMLDLPQAVTVVLASVTLSVTGYLLYRLWIGVAAGAMMAALALGVFGFYRVLPEVAPFNESYPAVIAQSDEGGFALLDAEQQRTYLEKSPRTWAHDFWTHLTAQQADVQRNVVVIGVAAALMGLLLGALATRPALIVCTALFGTALVGSGLAALAAALVPEQYQSALNHPVWLGGAGAVLLLASLVLQTALTRPPPAAPATAPAT
ncbi:MAG: hypothetical protein GY778_10080 [bacterium]|nr:hypothetical protein [bacterium]